MHPAKALMPTAPIKMKSGTTRLSYKDALALHTYIKDCRVLHEMSEPGHTPGMSAAQMALTNVLRYIAK